MKSDDTGRARRLREQRPGWPQRRDEPAPGRQRWLAEPEPFEDRGIREPYPGATVMEDMSASEDGTSSLRVLARYTVIRVLILCALGRVRRPKLRAEQRVARQHLALLPRHDWERHALERLLVACDELLEEPVVDAAVTAAEAAAKRGHVMGALGLYRAAYELARDRGWWTDAVRAAHGLEQLSRMNEARRSARTWRWRGRVMEARAARQAEADAAEAAAALPVAEDGAAQEGDTDGSV